MPVRLQHTRGWRRLNALVLAAAPIMIAATGVASAQTTGNSGGLLTGEGILAAFGFGYPGIGALVQPNNPMNFVELQGNDSPRYGFVKNNYIGVVLGYQGTYGVNYGGNVNINHRVPGRISFGNVQGSLRFNSDDSEALNGFPFSDYGFPNFLDGRPVGYGVWPLASDSIGNGFVYAYDYCSYIRAQVDGGAPVNVGFNEANTVQAPTFVSNTLSSEYILAQGTTGTVRLRMEIQLFRATARLRWIIINDDSVVHNVGLRFTVNVRGNISSGGNAATGAVPRTGYYFQDPLRGVSDQATVLPAGNIPDVLPIYGKRYEPENSTSPPATDPPFAAQHTYRGFGATPPTSVYVSDPFELHPDNGGYAPTFNSPTLNNGLATASYFGPFGVPAGGRQEVVTYYGNGHPSERYDADFVTATEAPESLAFDTNAVNRLSPDNPDRVVPASPLDVARQFLSPNPIQVFGSVYNRTQDNPLFNVNLNNVNAVLLLGQGLSFASPPGTTTLDSPAKPLGTNGQIPADRDAVASWYIQANGDTYGALPYQLTVSTREFGSRTIQRFINIPATPVKGVTNKNFQMIGFPFQFDPVLSNNGDPSTIINGSEIFRNNVDEPVAFYRWLPDPQSISGQAGRYELATKIEPGIAYFYRPNLNRTIVLRGAKPVPGQAQLIRTSPFGLAGDGSNLNPTEGAQQVQILLERGWNMITNPYVYDIPFNYLRFVSSENNPTAASQSFNQAINSGLIKAGIFFFDPEVGTYNLIQNLNDPIKPWQGYWIFLNSRVSIIYSVPTARNSIVLPTNPGPPPVEPPTRSQKNTDAIGSGKAFVANPTTENWRLHLVAQRSNGVKDRATILGVSRAVAEGDTRSDLPKPPPPVKDYVYVGILKKGGGTRYAQEILPAGATAKSWEVEVTSDQDGPVTLSWPNMASMPRRLSLSLKDLSTGRSVGLRSASSITVNVRKDQPSRFVITAKTVASQRLALSALNLARTRGGGFDISFHLNQEAAVTGRVKTLRGTVVQTFASGRSVAPGVTRLPWTGRAQDGTPLPAGPYLVEISATQEGGDTVRQTRPVTKID